MEYLASHHCNLCSLSQEWSTWPFTTVTSVPCSRNGVPGLPPLCAPWPGSPELPRGGELHCKDFWLRAVQRYLQCRLLQVTHFTPFGTSLVSYESWKDIVSSVLWLVFACDATKVCQEILVWFGRIYAGECSDFDTFWENRSCLAEFPSLFVENSFR
jgi:hypothetical protein